MTTIRPATAEDAELLTQIQQKAFTPLYERYHDAGNPCLRGCEDILNKLDPSSHYYYCIEEDGITVGGIVYRHTGKTPFHSQLQANQYYLVRIYIDPEYQGQHIALNAIRLCENQFANAVSFFVDFPADLYKNRKFYEKAGFRDTGNRLEVEPGMTLAGFEK